MPSPEHERQLPLYGYEQLEMTPVAQAHYERTVCDVAGRELTPNIARERALAIGQSVLGELTFNYDDDNKADILRDRLNELVDQNAFTPDEAHAIMVAWYELKGLR